MASIPSIPLASVLQSPMAQRAAGTDTEADASRAGAATRETAAIDEAQISAVENTDADTRVHADAGGLGGQGRTFDEQPAEDEIPADEHPSAPSAPGRLDVTA